MAVQQHAQPRHALPWWLELVVAAVVGAAILFGVLLVAGHSDLLPGTEAAPVVTPAALPYTQAD